MAADSKTFEFTLVTPEQEVLSTDVTSVIIPAYDGQMGILAHRAPIMTELGYGVLTAVTAEGETKKYYVASGFAQMTLTTLTVLADEAVAVEDIDVTAAKAELDAALADTTSGGAKAVERARGLVAAAS